MSPLRAEELSEDLGSWDSEEYGLSSEALPYRQENEDKILPNDKKDKVVLLSGRYLGQVGQLGIESRLHSTFTLAFHYGRFQGEAFGQDNKGIISGLDQFLLSGTYYLNSENKAFNGPFLRGGVQRTSYQKNQGANVILYKSKEVLKPGDEKYGPHIGVGYAWSKDFFFGSLGIDYFKVGAWQSVAPLSFSLGILF